MGYKKLAMMKTYGKVKVKRIKPDLMDIPDDCGYECQFKYNVDMNSNGIVGDCIAWCQINCEGRWGWWFEQNALYNPAFHNWEEQNAYMSFEKKRDASRFWLAIGAKNMGNKGR